jgi:hypothetical protein
MFWRILAKIAMDILTSLIVEFVLVTIRAFLVKFSKSQEVRFA